MLLPKFNFWKGDWALGYVSIQILQFSNISLFPKVLFEGFTKYLGVVRKCWRYVYLKDIAKQWTVLGYSKFLQS